MAKNCHKCIYYMEDRFVNYAECQAEENWPEKLTDEEVEEIILSVECECPIFELSELWYVDSSCACKCGENKVDNLEWIDDYTVKCLICGNVYKPFGEVN